MIRDIQQIIEVRLKDLWIYTDIAWMNVDYKPVVGTEFIQPIIMEDNAQMMAGIAHAGLFREEGALHIIVNVPAKGGMNRAFFLASELADIFRGYEEGGLFLGVSTALRIGETREWYKVNVITQFYFDACISGVAGAYPRLRIEDTIEISEDPDIGIPASLKELNLQNLINVAEMLDNERGIGYGHAGYGEHGYGGQQ